LKKWLVFLQNAFGNLAYVNQTNFNGKLRKKLGGQAKSGGPWPTQAPLQSPLKVSDVRNPVLKTSGLSGNETQRVHLTTLDKIDICFSFALHLTHHSRNILNL